MSFIFGADQTGDNRIICEQNMDEKCYLFRLQREKQVYYSCARRHDVDLHFTEASVHRELFLKAL